MAHAPSGPVESSALLVDDGPQGIGIAPSQALQIRVIQLDHFSHHTDSARRPSLPCNVGGPRRTHFSVADRRDGPGVDRRNVLQGVCMGTRIRTGMWMAVVALT